MLLCILCSLNLTVLLIFSVDLLVKVGEVVDKLFDLDEELMVNWIKKGSCPSVEQPTDDSPDDVPDFKILSCLLEAAKQVW